MRLPVLILACGMLLFGSINTIVTKIQDSVVVGTDPSTGDPLLFRHPAVQTAFMFAGEALCLIPFFFRQWLRSGGDAVPGSPTPRRKPPLRATALAFAVPALCDAGATTLLNLGLYYTYASVFQMLRGTLVVFAGVLTIVMLRRRLRSHNWLGMVLITAGAALVGASSIVYDKGDSGGSGSGGAPNPLLGNILVVLAQLLNAMQFIVEEKFLAQLRPPVLLAVGVEGVVGLSLCAVALPALHRLPGPGGLPIDDAGAALEAIAASSTLQRTTALTVISIALFNFCGVSVTKRLSGASRAAIDACRTALVWLYCLHAGWERFHMLQVVGFAVLITGTSVYNDILRSFLPPLPEPVHHHHHRSGRSRERHAARGGGSDAAEALLGGESEEEGVGEEEEGRGRSMRGAGSSGVSEGGPAEVVVTVEAAETPAALPPLPPASRSAAVSTRGPGGRFTTDAYTMARSVTVLPSALSPHSLASVPSADLLYLASVQSGMDLAGSEGSDSGSESGSESSRGSEVEDGAPDEQVPQGDNQRSR